MPLPRTLSKVELLKESAVYDVPLSMTGNTLTSRCIYPQVLSSHYCMHVSFSACASVHASGLVYGRNQCMLNSSMQLFRHWPLLLKGTLEANLQREVTVAQLRTSPTKLPAKVRVVVGSV